MLETIGFYLSFLMALFLFARGYIEAIKIANSQDRVYGGTLIFCLVFAFIFSKLTIIFI